MNQPGSVTLRIEDCLRRINDGDDAAKTELIDCAYERLVMINERIVGRMVSVDRGVRASDVFQSAYFRLSDALKNDNVNPKTVGEFMGLASRHIRFQVLDMLRVVARHKSEPLEATPTRAEESQMEMWICFFEAFDELPDEERMVADLLWTWVEGKGGPAVPNMTQYEAAEILNLTRDRVKDLWRKARIRISQRCKDFDPTSGIAE